MNKRIFAGALIAAVMIALPMASAGTDCAADIEKTQETFRKANIPQAGARNSIQGILSRARQSLNDGKKKRCEKLVAKANQLISDKNRPGCAAEIEKTQKILNKANIVFAGTRDSIQRYLDRARQSLDDGKKRRCGKLVVKAKRLIAEKEGAD